MLKARPMKRLFIAGLKEQMEGVIHEIYRHRLFHVQDFTEAHGEDYEGFRMGTPLTGAGEAAAHLVTVRGIMGTLGISWEIPAGAGAKIPASEVRGWLEKHLPLLRNEVENVISRRRSLLESDQKKYEDLLGEIQPFAAVPLDMDIYHGYDHLSVFAGHITRDVDIPGPHEKFFTDSVPGKFIAVFTPKENRNKVERILLDSNFKAIPIPPVEGSPAVLSREYHAKLAEIKGELAGIEQKSGELRKAHGEWLLASEELLTTDVEQKEIPLRFATTEQTFIAEGWVPAPEADRFVSRLNSALGGKIFVTELPAEEVPDQPPVEYDNPSFARPAELFMDVYSRPRYTEIDPTILLSIVFPVFFGLIVGDVGYGLLFLALAYGLGRFLAGPEGRMLLANLRNASIASIVFGVLFSEFLGFSLPWSPIIFSRHLNIGGHAAAHGPAIPELMVLSIWIGIAHITLGRIFGMINHARQDHGRHRTLAVLANLGWLCVMWGILVLIWSNFALPLMPDLTRGPPAGHGPQSGGHPWSGGSRNGDRSHRTGFGSRDRRITHHHQPCPLLCPTGGGRTLLGGYRHGGEFDRHRDAHRAPARESHGGGYRRHHRRGCCLPHRAYAECRPRTARRRTAFHQIALRRMVHEVLQGWREEVPATRDGTDLYGGLKW